MIQFLWNCLIVGGAGFVGAVLRYVVGLVLNAPGRPLGTLLINLSGSLLLGWFMRLVHERVVVSPTMQLAVGIGFVGAYTTFSTFMFETDGFVRDGSWFRASIYLSLSLFLGLIAVRLGWILGR